MAEYYPLISRAVAGLHAGRPEARRAIYDRARQALIGQLRAMDPPVPEEAIARETAALDEAIARTEAEIPPIGDSSTGRSSTERPAAPPMVEAAARKDAPTAAPPRAPAAPPPLGGARREPTMRPELPIGVKPRPPAPLIRPAGVRPGAGGAEAAPMPAVEVPSHAAASSDALGDHRDDPPRPAPGGPTFPAAPILRVAATDGAEPGTVESGLGTMNDDRSAVPSALSEGAREEPTRPAAPRPAEQRKPNLRVWIVAVAALAAVVAIAFTAWRLRDNPQQLARSAPVQTAAPAADKIAERADGSDQAQSTAAQTAAVMADQASQSTKEPAAASVPAGTPAEPQSTTGQSAGSVPTALATNAAQPATATAAQTDPSVPVSYKAAILVDSPDLPEKVKTYIGTVVWRKQTVALGQGQPLGTAIEADINIPDANTQLTMIVRRNTESQLPASHTIDLKFTIGPNSPIGGIKQINVPQLRQQDMPTGDPLAGIPVTIADNYFLIGLIRGAAEDHNLELLKTRTWFDIPLLLTSDKASKITFEKGAAGNQIFDDVIAGWKNAQN